VTAQSVSVFEEARRQYLPQPVRLVFITEAPPPLGSGRYFYFPDVRKGDSLFLELMKVLFPEEVQAFDTVKALRAEKTYFLDRFREEGFYLTNAVDAPQPDTTARARVKTYQANAGALIAQLDSIMRRETPVVFISAVAYEGSARALREAGFNVLNTERIEYPNSGQQLNFRRRLSRLLQEHQLLPAALG
jgi:hypothetical protein